MFFSRMPSTAFNGFNFCDEESVRGERNYYATRWIICDLYSGHHATPLFYEIYKERNLRCIFLDTKYHRCKICQGVFVLSSEFNENEGEAERDFLADS